MFGKVRSIIGYTFCLLISAILTGLFTFSTASGVDVLQIISVSLDRPTLHALGVQMLISGDANRNATVAVRYRPVGSTLWKDGPPLFRVFPETVTPAVPQQFAGSIFDLTPNTAYEIELHSTDTDGPVNDTRTITGTTRPVPRANPVSQTTVNVPADKGFQQALTEAAPGHVIVLADGIYTGSFSISSSFSISNSGTADNPIVIRGASDTGGILDGGNCLSCNVLLISGSYVHIEKLTIRNASRGIRYTGLGRTNNVVRRVKITNVLDGIEGDNGANYSDFYVCDNVIEGRNTFPDVVYALDADSHWDERGVELSGDGHVVCHNRISGLGDPILNKKELYRSFDVYGNDIMDSFDVVELDRAAGNVRVFHNQITNVSNGLSFQPTNGGPAYALRNVVLNPRQQLKFANTGGDPSGMLVYHNTFVSPVRALNLQNQATAHNFSILNNLFVGPTAPSGRTAEWTGKINQGKFDFNGYFPDGRFWMGKIDSNKDGIWEDQLYDNFAQMQASGVFEGGGTLLTEPIFASGMVGPVDGQVRQEPADFTLASGSNAHDRGTVLVGINHQGFTGTAPDLGALETGSGCPNPIYGPRPLGSEHLASLIVCIPDAPDTTPPTVSITAPINGATVSGTITVSADASDNVGVAGVQFKLDGANLGAEERFAPYEIFWDTTTASNGSHTLTAVARDAAGNQTTSAPVTVTVSNDITPPVISGVSSSNISSSGATITWSTDELSDSQVEYGTTTAYGSSTTLDPTPVTAHSQNLTGLTSSTLYHYRVKSRDAAGNLAVSGDFTFTTSDTTPPTVSITAPTSGATVSGTITVSANASDNVGIAGVQFKLDGANLGAEDTTAPYSVPWNTTNTSNGSHTLTAVARDTAGNQTTSAPVTVTVSNDITPPVISGVSSSNISSSGATITWSTDELSDSQVEYGTTTAYGTATTLDTALVTSHSQTLSGLTANTLYHYRVKSRDAAGNLAVSGDFTFTTASGPTVENVTWTSLVNVTVTGTTIKKTSGIDGTEDAGAISSQTITSGDGYVEFTAPDNTMSKAVGLSNGNPGTTRGEIDFAFYVRGLGSLQIRENGVLRLDSTYAAGDVFRVAVEGGVVRYYQNDVLRYTSTIAPTYPLLVDSSFLTLNSSITNAVIFRGQ